VTDEKLDIRLVDMPINMFKITLPKSVKPGKPVKGEIEVSDEFLSKEFEKSITIEFTGKETSRFTIPVKRVIRIPGEKDKEANPDTNVSKG